MGFRNATQRTKVRVVLRFARGETLLVVVAQEFVEEVDSVVGNVPLVFRSDEAGPWLALIPTTATKKGKKAVNPKPIQTCC